MDTLDEIVESLEINIGPLMREQLRALVALKFRHNARSAVHLELVERGFFPAGCPRIDVSDGEIVNGDPSVHFFGGPLCPPDPVSFDMRYHGSNPDRNSPHNVEMF